MAVNLKGIPWFGSIYDKFENMCLEVEETMFEDTVKYIENQMQTVGVSVKKLYSDVVQDLLPPSSCDKDSEVASELVTDKHADAEFCKKSFQGSEKITRKVDAKHATEDSRIHHDATQAEYCDANAMFESATNNSVKGNISVSYARQYGWSADTEPNLGSDIITLLELYVSSVSQPCEPANESQSHAVAVSKPPSSSEVTRLASVADCCNEIENASSEKISNVQVLVKSAEEKEMNMSDSSSSVESEDLDDIETVEDQGNKTMQQDDELNLDETCVMVTRDELQFVPMTKGALKTNKKKRHPFSLSKKSARKQEYEELAVWHGNNEKEKGGDCVENSCPTSLEGQKKLLPSVISEHEWELL